VHLLLFQFAMSRGPHVLVPRNANNIALLPH